jgi:hypothetical protein
VNPFEPFFTWLNQAAPNWVRRGLGTLVLAIVIIGFLTAVAFSSPR